MIEMMKTEQNYQQVGQFVYGLHRAGFQLALLTERMGKPPALTRPGEPPGLAGNATEADVMFARLPASDAVKAEFSALMHSLTGLSAKLDRLSALGPEEIAACDAGASAAVLALPRFRAIADHLLGGP